MTPQFCCKFIFVFGFLQFVVSVYCDDARESHNTNVLERAFGNVLTKRLEKQTKATEEMFEIKLADHRDKLNEMFDTKQEEQRNQIRDDVGQVLDAKFEQQKDGFVQLLDDKFEKQKDDFVQLLDDKMEQEMEKRNQRMNVKFEQLQTALEQQKELLQDQKETFEQKIKDQEENITKSLKENHAMVLYSLAKTFIADNVKSNKSCPTNWNQVFDSCIFLSSEYAEFDNATEKCKDLDGKLYEPQSLFHNQLVSALIEEKGQEGSSFWIGIHDKYTEGSFVYQSNNQSIAFKHWGSFNDGLGTQPNNHGGDQNCAEILGKLAVWDGPKGSWNDRECSFTKNFICEKETQ